MLTFKNGVTLAQTTAILIPLGDQHGLAGTTDTQEMQATQYLCDLTDIKEEANAGKLEEKPERAEKWCGLLEGWLGSGFFIGESLSVADFYAFFVLLWVATMGISIEKYPALVKLNAMVGESRLRRSCWLLVRRSARGQVALMRG